MKVLIADDSRVMRQIIIRSLRQAGFSGLTLVQASDGTEAYELALSELPDLVLSDWNMPGATGLEVLQRLRRGGHRVPFGFVTSESSPHRRATASAAGASFLIGKPFEPEDFRDALDGIAPRADTDDADAAREGRPTDLPSPKDVRDVVEALVGREVSVGPGELVSVGPREQALVGVYVDDGLRMGVVIALDLALAVRTAAALDLVPAATADVVVAAGELPGHLRGNADEVLNVLSRLVNQPGTPHLRLYGTYGPGDTLPIDAVALVNSWGRRLDLALGLATYGTGRLSLVLAD